jgi:hypothetical protein
LPGRKRISARGVCHFQSFYFAIVLLSFFTLFLFASFYQKYKKIVPTIVVIFVGLLLSCFLLASSCFLSMVDFFETRSYWQGGFTEEQQQNYKEHRFSQKGKHLWEQINKLYIITRNVCSTYNVTYCFINLVAIGGINTSLLNVSIMIMLPYLLMLREIIL